MLSSPTPDQVRSLAPDPGAARVGEGLGHKRYWSATGRNDAAAWGLCQGSGKDPYQVIVDFGGPAFKCSCPSRKFPCKHGLGILFLLAADASLFPAADPPGWATEWLASRTQRAERAEARAAAAESAPARSPEQEAASREKRVKAREKKVDAGLVDLDRWLQDLVRRGLAAAKGEGYAFWDQAGARLVDAQAASLGREVRTLGAIANSGGAWAETALERISRLHLISEAYRRLDALPDDLRADVRALVGWTVKEDELPEDGAVTDRWLAIGRIVTGDDRLTTARTWLVGETTARFALHLAFGAGGANPAPIALPGMSFLGRLTFYPSATPLRASATEAGSGAAAGMVTSLPGGTTIQGAAATFASVLARNPFLLSWPVILADVVPVGRDGDLLLRDADGATVPVTPEQIGARLLALAGGHAVSVFGQWSGRSIRVLSAMADGRLVDLGTDIDAGDAEAAVPARGGEHDPWGQLVSAALLGTQRAEPPTIELPAGAVALAERPRETRLLGAAAVLGTLRRAGWTAATDDGPVPEPAPADDLPAVDAAAGWLLRRTLDERPELAAEWLDAAAATGVRPPHEELPRLIAFAARSDEIRDALRPLLGHRAAWLVGQLPHLGPGAASVAEEPEEAFEGTAGAAARAALLRELRGVDAARARRLLESAWEDATVEERARGLEAMVVNLGPEDLPLLERARADRRAEVRAAAVDLLARLPDSEFARSAEAAAQPLLASVGRLRPSLVARLPEWSDAFDDLGIVRKPPHGTGEKAWWLRQLIALIPPGRWEGWLGADPGALVERAFRGDEAGAIVHGWVEATGRFGDPRWAMALLSEPKIARSETGGEVDPEPLLASIPARERDAFVTRLVPGVDQARAAKFATSCPRPWSAGLTRAVMMALFNTNAVVAGGGFYDLLRLMARRADPGLAEILEEGLFADERRRYSGPIVDAVDVLRYRHQVATTFAKAHGGTT